MGASASDGEERCSSPAKRPYNTLPTGRRSASPRKSLKSFSASSPGSGENAPPLPVRPFDPNRLLSPPPSTGPETARIQLGSLSNNEVNGISGPPVAAPISAAGGFTAVNMGNAVNTPPAQPVREPSYEASRAPSVNSKPTSPVQNRGEVRTYTSPYDTAAQAVAMPSVTPDPHSLPAPSAAPASAQTFQNSPTPINGVVSRESSDSRRAQQTHTAPQHIPQHTPQLHPQPQDSPQIQASQIKARTESQTPALTPSKIHAQLHQQQTSAQPPSRTHTPGGHHVGRSIAPHPSSRSNTPFAQDAALQPNKTHNQHIAPAPVPMELHAPMHGMRIVPAVAAVGHPQIVQPPPPVAASIQPPQPVLKSQHVEAAPHDPPKPAPTVVDLRLLQCEVLALLIQYLFPRAASPPDEVAVLTRISYLWYHGEAIFRAELGPHHEISSRVLTAWLHERQAISSLRHSLLAQPGVNAAGLMDRLLAMNDLRVMRLKWKNMSTLDGVSPEDLLCRVFAVMANTENTEHLFRDGLDRLNRGVFEFLRNEDSKIVMHRR